MIIHNHWVELEPSDNVEDIKKSHVVKAIGTVAQRTSKGLYRVDPTYNKNGLDCSTRYTIDQLSAVLQYSAQLREQWSVWNYPQDGEFPGWSETIPVIVQLIPSMGRTMQHAYYRTKDSSGEGELGFYSLEGTKIATQLVMRWTTLWLLEGILEARV